LDTVIYILVLVSMAIVFFQDLKMRAIHILLPLFILVLGIVSFFRGGYDPMIIVYSSLFLCLTFTGLYLYLSAKHKKFTNPFKENMGVGDVLFFIAVLPFFSTYNYILFFVTGMLFSIIGFLIIKLFSKTDLVPLAGLLALYFILLKLGMLVYNEDLFMNKII